ASIPRVLGYFQPWMVNAGCNLLDKALAKQGPAGRLIHINNDKSGGQDVFREEWGPCDEPVGDSVSGGRLRLQRRGPGG
ncbi:MAG TPA: hypothetical protein VLT91_14415, partial [Rhizomicrobium sp.]|nr:hypothetical protein [Rhizomicrobium sp.]